MSGANMFIHLHANEQKNGEQSAVNIIKDVIGLCIMNKLNVQSVKRNFGLTLYIDTTLRATQLN